MKYSTMLSSLLAGGLLFGSAFVRADRGVPPAPPAPPAAPTAGAPPRAPKPPKAPKAPKGVKITIDGLDQMIESQIEGALDMIGSDDSVPPEVRDKLAKKLEKLRGKLKQKFGNGPIDADEITGIGDEFSAEMEDFSHEMEKWGEKWGDKVGKDFEKKFKDGFKVQIGSHDDDDDDDDNDIADLDADDDADDIDAAVQDMGSLALKPQQRDQIKRLRADSDAKVATAKQELDRASEALQKQLANPAASDADIARSIDAVAQQEAAIRKARILAWVNARRILDDSQRKKVESAKGKSR